jgi:predicted oxidoreductase (fatty acid repression mutant protein)
MADNNSKNTKNSDSVLFKRLTKLFSGPIINYRSQNTRQLRRRKLEKYATTFNDVAGQKFERLDYNPFNSLSSYTMGAQSRVQRYNDFEQMEYTPEIASALDI